MNMDLPKVDKFFANLDNCNTAKTSKYCNKGTEIWIWECVGYRMQQNILDFHILNAPAKFGFGLGADGFVFAHWAAFQAGKYADLAITRCRESFSPPSNSDYIQLMPWENQYVIEEYTLGSAAGERPISYGTNNWTLPVNKEGRGILCFFDKLYTTSFYFGNIASDNKDKTRPVGYYLVELLFQPVRVQRFDYFEVLLDRMKCGHTCLKPNLHFWPCLTEECVFQAFKNAKDEDIINEIKPFDFGTGGRSYKGTKLTGKDYKDRKGTNDDPAYDPYIEVKVVSKSMDCIDYQNEIKKLNDQLATRNKIIGDLAAQLNETKRREKYCEEKFAMANDQIKTLTAFKESATKSINDTNSRNFNRLLERWIRYIIPFLITKLEQSSKEFDRSFISILQNYLPETKLEFKNDRLDSFRSVLEQWSNIPPERQGPIAPYLILICLVQMFQNYDNLWKFIDFFNGNLNTQSINYLNFLRSRIVYELDSKINDFDPVPLPYYQVPQPKSSEKAPPNQPPPPQPEPNEPENEEDRQNEPERFKVWTNTLVTIIFYINYNYTHSRFFFLFF